MKQSAIAVTNIYTISEKRQVFDVAQSKSEVTEHQALEKKCPCYGELTRGIFPEHIKGPVQYAEHIQALMLYFTYQHFIPIDRLCQIFENVFGISISLDTCSNVDAKLFRQLESFESRLKIYLLIT